MPSMFCLEVGRNCLPCRLDVDQSHKLSGTIVQPFDPPWYCCDICSCCIHSCSNDLYKLHRILNSLLLSFRPCHPSVRPSDKLSVCLILFLCVWFRLRGFVYLCVCLYICLCVCICLCVHLFVSICICVYLSGCLGFISVRHTTIARRHTIIANKAIFQTETVPFHNFRS